jgi:hypothetical protein
MNFSTHAWIWKAYCSASSRLIYGGVNPSRQQRWIACPKKKKVGKILLPFFCDCWIERYEPDGGFKIMAPFSNAWLKDEGTNYDLSSLAAKSFLFPSLQLSWRKTLILTFVRQKIRFGKLMGMEGTYWQFKSLKREGGGVCRKKRRWNEEYVRRIDCYVW